MYGVLSNASRLRSACRETAGEDRPLLHNAYEYVTSGTYLYAVVRSATLLLHALGFQR
jgi:hypothetical protein